MYKYIDVKNISKDLKDGKYFCIAKVSELTDEGFKIENCNINFLSIFKVNREEFVRVFFTKDKEDFIVDILQKIDFEKFLEFNEKYQKFKNLYI